MEEMFCDLSWEVVQSYTQSCRHTINFWKNGQEYRDDWLKKVPEQERGLKYEKLKSSSLH